MHTSQLWGEYSRNTSPTSSKRCLDRSWRSSVAHRDTLEQCKRRPGHAPWPPGRAGRTARPWDGTCENRRRGGIGWDAMGRGKKEKPVSLARFAKSRDDVQVQEQDLPRTAQEKGIFVANSTHHPVPGTELISDPEPLQEQSSRQGKNLKLHQGPGGQFGKHAIKDVSVSGNWTWRSSQACTKATTYCAGPRNSTVEHKHSSHIKPKRAKNWSTTHTQWETEGGRTEFHLATGQLSATPVFVFATSLRAFNTEPRTMTNKGDERCR